MDYTIAASAVAAAVAAICVQIPGLRLPAAVQAVLALLALAVVGRAEHLRKVTAVRRRTTQLVVSIAGIWTATQAGLLVCHVLFGRR